MSVLTEDLVILLFDDTQLSVKIIYTMENSLVLYIKVNYVLWSLVLLVSEFFRITETLKGF